MESECENTRRWLLQAERYEDAAKFDASVEARERFCKERGSYHCHDVAVMEPEAQKDNEDFEDYVPNTDNVEILKAYIRTANDVIRTQKQRLKDNNIIISTLKSLLGK